MGGGKRREEGGDGKEIGKGRAEERGGEVRRRL